ncbi:MAG: murein biosynthesis integral membrane protein MurJ [Candidatus Doudnabacteria bacterium RIFCSPLOWO2_02_FULL_49_13]|uniref:Probable lipid II flippase MurJ n=1 Tax=Candidatus Doudnabacteria bacterium RIFCSPHIGHO2_12_FULL_48_16 TaxID=1817838 RepID=A0A1F5PLU0_9BACT|nr:MAG: murein biosynthesis integral membrane protein MurJ [Candidatus Doudnabacteria bacterium RIFCSPHIGHO2_02_FULL_49_24]OGE89452.1 MAG: murein biosynthesis integral membrane protein MurJ [Candidatus Doudnabacteria bacterium RIFCSPHIGHO2_01_FULL_50_67]OGE90847.1 MAG: murein biosynthesis integral membrane protein MurJ [Candidatus Doudnabacteria bacterium RIFCSPHIGHO2_12_FULL_48_16]OGE97558.1 MAG: murein biosynthesis integral membrane protein MurJ [Candidatus Doudnabacteria bacterium RIFCSPLOWO2
MTLKHLHENKIAQATVIIAVFSLLAKILGLVRDAVFSHQFGTSRLMDAYFAAFRLPDFIYNLLILGTFSVAFIPVFSEYLFKDREQANKLASSIINATLLMMLGLTALAFIFINPLTHAIAPGFSGESFDLTRLFTRIFLLSPLFLTLSSIVSSILNTHKRFALVASAPIVYNLSIIVGAIWLYPRWGPLGLALGVLLGAILHFGVQVPQIFRIGFHYTWGIVDSAGFRKFWTLYWPRIFSMGTEQVTSLIVTIFGSFLGAGALAAFYYANNLQSVFLGIFAVSFAVAVFPLLSDLFNKEENRGFKDVLAKTSVQILFFIIPLSILTLVLRAQIVRLVLGFGQNTHFTFADTKIVAEALGLFAVSLFAQALIPLFSRAFYAMHNTVTPVIIGFVVILFNIGTTYYLTRHLGIAGMALAYSMTSVIHLALLVMDLHRRLGNLHDEYLTVNVLKIIIASLLGGIAAYVSLYVVADWVNMRTYWGVLIQGVSSGAAGIVCYLFIGWLLGLSETHDLVKLLRSVLGKMAQAVNFYAR